MPAVLDITALRSIVAVADQGGFHRAAESLMLSQSAVSQHVRRLEKAVGRPLVRKDGRASRFTPEGEALIGEARRILAAHDDALRRLGVGDPRESLVLGSTEHAADELLPRVMARLQEVFPGVAVRFRLDRSSRLNDAVDRGTLDLAMYIGDPADAPAGLSVHAGAIPLTWYAAPGWRRPVDAPIPLVVIDSPCTIRRRALRILSDNGLPATVVGEAAYLAGVLNAARGGLGVALVAGLGAAPEGLEVCSDLPPVPPERLHLRVRAGSDQRLLETAVGALSQVLVGEGAEPPGAG
ncbi:LysR substrate-binding domain-containing protein [Pseudonocardia sp. NPDC049635]|uniref:LysR substrate-binding domain-containing protein n=1 Tax=Pseudonocardia sp. NPDC049635 TaxID=3155506 RepID=UPI0033CE6655